MKKTLLILLLWAGIGSLQAAHQWIPHLSANDDFKSDIWIRNDSFDETLAIEVVFYAADGSDAVVDISDSQGTQSEISTWTTNLAPQSGARIQLIAVRNGDMRSVQATVLGRNTAGTASSLVAVEASFTRFSDGVAASKVGVALTPAAPVFAVNTPADELRGFGITNTDEGQACECAFTLVDNSGAQRATTTATIPARGKWLGVVDTLFSGYADTLGGGLGQVRALCSTPVVVQGLAFNGAVTSGVPVTGYPLTP